ncbi:MAG: hypothetical protein Q9217_006456 [Psora testacea]
MVYLRGQGLSHRCRLGPGTILGSYKRTTSRGKPVGQGQIASLRQLPHAFSAFSAPRHREMDLTSSNVVALALALFLVYIVCLALYRLYFSPLARFPGPTLAALTLWYEFYYDVIKRGNYTFKLQDLHDQYGPIVRISPRELHINDPEFYDELYVGGSVRKTQKYLWAVRMFGRSTSTFGTVEHEVHRVRRAALSPFFSKSSVQRLEPIVQSVVDKLVSRLQDLKGSGATVNVIDAFAALTGDVIWQYAFAASPGFMEHPDFAPFWHETIMALSANGYLINHFTWLEPLMRSMPLWLTGLISPGMIALINQQLSLEKQVNEMKASLAQGKKDTEQRTIFYDILSNDQVRPQEKETEHLVTEAQAVVGAGTVTTAHTLSILVYHLLSNPDILARTQNELRALMADLDTKPRWQHLEQLPYLNAVVTEGLRLSYGATHRLQRIFPDTALQYQTWTIPPGTPVGMTSVLIHNNPAIFPTPKKFDPERWLQPSATQLKKYFVSFSKGSRSCLGMK